MPQAAVTVGLNVQIWLMKQRYRTVVLLTRCISPVTVNNVLPSSLSNSNGLWNANTAFPAPPVIVRIGTAAVFVRLAVPSGGGAPSETFARVNMVFDSVNPFIA